MTNPVQEKPICEANYEDCQNILEAFYCMTKNNQNEYLKLYKRHEDSQDFDWMPMVQSELEAKIVGIYKTNAFEKGVGILSSLFNHRD